jgi:hypothetical protein
MSYILNALKKAERDRKREDSEDLDDFVSAGWDPYQEPTENNNSYKVAAIIVLIALLLCVGFYSLTKQVINDTIPASELQQTDEVIAHTPVEKQIIQQSDGSQNTPVIEEPVEASLELEALQLPEVAIAGHIYIRSGSPKNRIFIGEKTYYVGDRIDSDWVIESINFDSLNIRSGVQRSEIPLR